MKKFYRSQFNLTGHKPYISKWRRVVNFFKKKSRPKISLQALPPDNYLNNPFSRPRPKKNLKKKILTIILALTIPIWIFLMINLAFFRITRINVSGQKIIDGGEVTQLVRETYLNNRRAFGLLRNDNYFLASTAEIGKLISDKYSLDSINVKKDFPKTINIRLSEKISSIIYDNSRNYFLLDSEGSAMKDLGSVESANSTTIDVWPSLVTSTAESTSTPRPIPDFQKFATQLPDYPLLADYRARLVSPNQRDVISKDLINFLLDLYKRLPSEGIGKVDYFDTEEPLAGIGAHCGKLVFYFQQKNDLSAQINNLKIILSQKKPTQYVDLRVGERVFWK